MIIEENVIQTPVSFYCYGGGIKSQNHRIGHLHKMDSNKYRRWASLKEGTTDKKYKARIVNKSPFVYIVNGEDFVKEQFNYLKEKWYSEIMFISDPYLIIENNNYKAITNLGLSVVPYIIDDMKKNNTHWFDALYKIFEVNPIKPEHNGIVPKMVSDWVEYLENNNF
jgi:hypothetical protein